MTLLQAPAQATEGGPCQGRWHTQAQNARGIRCVWHRFDPGYGGTPKALDVARCESGLNPRAYGNGNGGLFQHRLSLWPGRFHNFIERHPLRDSWGLSASVYSGRTNAIVTALMVRRSSWSAWSCA